MMEAALPDLSSGRCRIAPRTVDSLYPVSQDNLYCKNRPHGLRAYPPCGLERAASIPAAVGILIVQVAPEIQETTGEWPGTCVNSVSMVSQDRISAESSSVRNIVFAAAVALCPVALTIWT
jgi:hypothetical protein